MALRSKRFATVLLLGAGVLAIVAFFTRQQWLAWIQRPEPAAANSSQESTTLADKIIVSDQAQKNLNLKAERLKAGAYWKTIEVFGSVVNRPGCSDCDVVAPAIGSVTAFHHVTGDIVRPGDKLFAFKLSSEPLHQTQTELFKAVQDIKFEKSHLERLKAVGNLIPPAKIIEVENQIQRLEATAKSARHELAHRGLSSADIEGIADGAFVNETTILAPKIPAAAGTTLTAHQASGESDHDDEPLFELQELNVEIGQQVQAGQTLCLLSNHRCLAIEGKAFRDETSLLERTMKQAWPVEVAFEEEVGSDWPPVEQTFHIEHVANTIDPINRTFAFIMPLDNQCKTIERNGKQQMLWRFRPGQKVRLRVRVEKLDDVFVLPADGVVREGAEVFLFTQNVNTFERKGVHVLYQDREHAVVANDGSLSTYKKKDEVLTISAIALNAASQLNRMSKSGGSTVPKGYHIHADGSLHKNENEGK